MIVELRRAGMRQSMSAAENCYDNAFMESCFGTVKTELELVEYGGPAEAVREISEYFRYYDLLQVFRTDDSLILDGWRRAVRCRRAVPGSQVIGHGPNVGSTPGS